MENMTMLFDRARQVVLKTGVEELEHVSERTRDENDRSW